MPSSAACRGERYEHVKTFKHDFFAATGLYQGPSGLAVLKIGREQEFLGLPMEWLGAFLAAREIRLYTLMQDSPGVPGLIGPVGKTGLLHDYILGHPLGRREQVSDTFFDELLGLISDMHDRHIAYVDLNKRQNVLMGEDGKPYLVDFQISLHMPPRGWGRLWPARWLLVRLQHADRYHCLKHKRRLRPDLLTPAEKSRVERLSIWIRIHRVLTRPFTQLRRRTLKRLRRGEEREVVGSSAK